MVLLRSGQAGDRERAAFETWRTADPAHDAACDRVNVAFQRLRRAARNAVSRGHGGPPGRARPVAPLRHADHAGPGGPGHGPGAPVCCGWQVAGDQGLLADQHTGFAQRRQEALRRWQHPAAGRPHRAGRRLPPGPAHADAAPWPDAGDGHRHARRAERADGARPGVSGPRQAQFVVQQRRGTSPLQVTTLKGQVGPAHAAAGESLELAAGRHATVAGTAPAHGGGGPRYRVHVDARAGGHGQPAAGRPGRGLARLPAGPAARGPGRCADAHQRACSRSTTPSAPCACWQRPSRCG